MDLHTRPAISAVVFDLGGVLIDWDPRYLYRRLFDDEAAMEAFLADGHDPGVERAQDAGRPWAEADRGARARASRARELIAAYWRALAGDARRRDRADRRRPRRAARDRASGSSR